MFRHTLNLIFLFLVLVLITANVLELFFKISGILWLYTWPLDMVSGMVSLEQLKESPLTRWYEFEEWLVLSGIGTALFYGFFATLLYLITVLFRDF